MPITAFSRELGRELDVEQWLGAHGYTAHDDAELVSIPDVLRGKASLDIECSCCGVGGAILVGRGRGRATGKAISQNHFRFRGDDGSNPHHPLCDYFDEKKNSGSDYLTNFVSDRTPLTQAIRRLVCQGLEGKLFSQHDMRRMRQWFLQVKAQNAFVMDVTPELLRWCVDLWRVAKTFRPTGNHQFRPSHGSLPAFDWAAAAEVEWTRRNAELVDLCQTRRAFFHQSAIVRPLKLAELYAGETVFDPTPLREHYEAAQKLAHFAAAYLFEIGPVGTPAALRKHVSEWGKAGHALLAFSALLLFLRDWDIEAGVDLFVQMRTRPPVEDRLAGNLIGLNPFHDYEAWRLIGVARQVNARRTDRRSVSEQVEDVLIELQHQYACWVAQ